MKMRSFLIILLLLIRVVSFAQTDFTGSYSIQSFQPNDDRYSHVIPKSIIVMQSHDSVLFHKVTIRSNGVETPSVDLIKANGDTLRTHSVDGRKKLNCGQWSNGKTQLTSVSVYFGEDSTKQVNISTDVWSISGGQLLLDRKYNNFLDGSSYEVKAVYKKVD